MKVNTFKEHLDRVIFSSFNLSSSLIATVSYDRSVKVWVPETGEIFRNFSIEELDEDDFSYSASPIGPSSKVSFSDDGKFLVLGSGPSSLITWEVNTGRLVQKITSKKSGNYATAFSPDGTLFLSTQEKGLLYPGKGLAYLMGSENLVMNIGIWNIRTMAKIAMLPVNDLVTSISISANNRFIASNNFIRGATQLWDLDLCEAVRTWQYPPSRSISSIAISPDNIFLAIVMLDSIKVWNLDLRQEVYSFNNLDYVTCMCFDSRSQILAVSTTSELESEILFWDMDTGNKISTISSKEVFSITFSPNNKLFAISSFNHTVEIWQAPQCDRPIS